MPPQREAGAPRGPASRQAQVRVAVALPASAGDPGEALVPERPGPAVSPAEPAGPPAGPGTRAASPAAA
ncbi:2-oxoglutarate dehydrogenase, E2 component, dihydrolipoamide succinyltransferase, partial [Streptomyces liangshanensis]